MPRLRPALAMALVTLAGCRLIDQRTFERSGVAPGPAQVARSADLAAAAAARPLVSVYPGKLDQDWPPVVLAAVRDALIRHPDANFDIVTPFPSRQGAEAQRQAILTGSQDAAAVAGVIQADGVAAERLHLGSRGDSGAPAREVMVFLR